MSSPRPSCQGFGGSIRSSTHSHCAMAVVKHTGCVRLSGPHACSRNDCGFLKVMKHTEMVMKRYCFVVVKIKMVIVWIKTKLSVFVGKSQCLAYNRHRSFPV